MLGWLLSWPLAAVTWLFSPLTLTLLALLLAYVYYRVTRDFDFWKSRGVGGPEARFPWGHERGLPFAIPLFEFCDWLYHQHGGKKFCGYFEIYRPVLFVGDPDLVRTISIKDFEYFTDRRDTGAGEAFKDALSVVNGVQWKETRAVMSPTFSASKLKAMHQLTLDNAQNLSHYLLQEMADKGEVEMKDMFGRFTMDNIASCAFGVNCNSFTDPNSKFASNASALFSFNYLAILRFVAELCLPMAIVKRIPDPNKKSIQFFTDVVNKTMAHRDQHPTATRDFLQLLMDTKDKEGRRILTTNSIVTQSVLFFLAGYDTTATLLTFAGYCLALSPDIQRSVQQEVDETVARHDGQLTYEAVQEMTLLERVMSETLRLYPPAMVLERLSSKEYTLPDSGVTLPRGTLVQVPVFSIHRDPDHYPDPLRFDPDRFLPEEKEKRHPCAYLPFGSGPRNCIAMRFALFETKVALAAVLKDMTLKPTPTTPPHPMPLEKKAFLITPEGRRLPLIAERRSGAE